MLGFDFHAGSFAKSIGCVRASAHHVFVMQYMSVRPVSESYNNNNNNNNTFDIAQFLDSTVRLHLCTAALHTLLHSGVPKRPPLQSLCITK